MPFSRFAMAAAERIAYTTEPLVFHHVDNRNSLEANKDAAPLTPFVAHQLLWEQLGRAGLLEPLRQSLLNYFCTCYCYNFCSLRTEEARRAFRDCFLKTAVPCFGIDLSDSAFFYNQSEYRELKELAETEQGLSPLPQVL